MNRYLADLHVHTVASDDGRSALSEQVNAAKAAGLHALAVTDHNCCTQVPAMMEGILLIPGCEISSRCGHILGLFLERPIDLDSTAGLPSGESAVAAIRAAGGLAVLAHPFQDPLREEKDLPADIDGIETCNSRGDLKRSDANARAKDLARKLQLPETGGSDAHHQSEVGYAYTEFAADALTCSALREALVQGKCQAVLRRRTSYTQKGLSQWESAKKKTFLRKIKGILYLLRNILKDLTVGKNSSSR